MEAVNHKPKKLKERKGWHCLKSPHAPHLGTKGRVWVEVECHRFLMIPRPASQGGEWILADRMMIIKLT